MCLLLLTACKAEKPLNQAEQIEKDGKITVGTLYGPTTYYISKDGPVGFEYELIKGFADYLNVELDLKPSYSMNELFPQLESDQLDFIAAALAVTPERQAFLRFAPSYQTINQIVVFKQGNDWPRNLSQLKGNLTVVNSSSHDEYLNQEEIKQQLNIEWNKTDTQDVEELMQAVLNGEINYTVVDSNHLAINRRIYPELSKAFTLKKGEELAWAFKQSQDDSLYALFIDYFGKMQTSGKLAVLEDKYFGHVRQFNYVDTREFLASVEKVLPKYLHWFKQYAEQYAIDWRLLAAISYQESHWNPRAKSPTGVRGIMMLTQPTAKQVGVTNRLEPEQNIRGGARYISSLMKRIPARIQNPDRLWFALAAYNIGLGHLEDARRLTQRLGGSPDKWIDVKKYLPLLRKKQYYKTTRYGYARGNEAVTYVANIRRYYDSLLWLDNSASLPVSQNITEQSASK
ncbi:membrane-bound lytic murein transglycosylase MltF [Catenovulum sp. SM1970]|uniref:membrane-bound lytic murein transglycosylase MltF n=1 Tax=Marinifaba aquimaris TaxID=2741323 RepID=UPI0015730235|nr:membrane-bound lytic murein transglycosylase MltF [Marinifaba aquimaris]NTS75506.1 membrane-bound lytic murein transglycosylase MltF [Marinifaba aquimaris]